MVERGDRRVPYDPDGFSALTRASLGELFLCIARPGVAVV